MCFYRDTQAALERNNLQNFIKQRSHGSNKTVVAQNREEIEDKFYSEPYKRLHITKNLYEDLLKLSAGDPCPTDEITTEENSVSEEEIIERNDIKQEEPVYSITTDRILVQPVAQECAIQDVNRRKEILLESLKNTEIQGKYEKSCDFSYFKNIANMLEKNNKMLNEFTRTQEGFRKNITEYCKTSKLCEESPFERLEKASQNEKHRLQYSSNPSPVELLSYFTGGRTEFPYELVLSSDIPVPVFRERNLRIGMSLVRKSDNTVVTNHGNMLLQMSLHTWELPPVTIVRNKAGNKVLQGEDECLLKNGEGVFDKIQINEVTSKFIGGYIGILVVPKRPVNFGTSLESLHLKNSVRIEDIKPLLIVKLIVKSKKKRPTNMIESTGGDNI